MTLPLTRRRFTVREYHQMAKAGILTEDDRVELIDGEIIDMAPIGSRHAGCVKRLNDLFSQRFSAVALISVQDPIHLNDRNEPQPDVALLRRRADYYTSGHPGPEDIFLIVEVADASIEVDRQVKVPLYARSGIPEVWLVDLNEETLTVYRDPTADGYRTSWAAQQGDRLAPLAFPDRDLAVADILGGSSG